MLNIVVNAVRIIRTPIQASNLRLQNSQGSGLSGTSCCAEVRTTARDMTAIPMVNFILMDPWRCYERVVYVSKWKVIMPVPFCESKQSELVD